MQAEVRFEATQIITDREYVGTVVVTVLEEDIQAYREFEFTMSFPNEMKNFRVVITSKRDNKIVLEHVGARPSHEQIAAYSQQQMAIFLLLFRAIVDAVKQAQLAYGGATRALPLSGVMETIKTAGKEPLASIIISKRFTWKPEDRDLFEATCEALL
jgi:hypothetical protein